MINNINREYPQKTCQCHKKQLSDTAALKDISQNVKTNPAKPWTILCYLAADVESGFNGQSIEKPMVENVIDMEKVGSNENMNIIVQLDRGENPSDISGGWKGCKRFYIEKNQKNNQNNSINSNIIKDFGADGINMAEPKVLEDFILESCKEYPSDNIMLILNDHGAGWLGVLEDYSDNNGSMMNIQGIKTAIKNAEEKLGKKINIIGFDACVMGQVEVAYELKGLGEYMIGSQEVIGGKGWPYSKILNKMNDSIKKSREDKLLNDLSGSENIVKKIINECGNLNKEGIPTISAIKLGQNMQEQQKFISKVVSACNFPNALSASEFIAPYLDKFSYLEILKDSFDAFSDALIKTGTPDNVIKDIANSSGSFGAVEPFNESKDIVDLANRINQSSLIMDNDLKEASREVVENLNNAVLASQNNKDLYPYANGLSVYFPGKNFLNEYSDTQWSKNSNWDEALSRFNDVKTDYNNA